MSPASKGALLNIHYYYLDVFDYVPVLPYNNEERGLTSSDESEIVIKLRPKKAMDSS